MSCGRMTSILRGKNVAAIRSIGSREISRGVGGHDMIDCELSSPPPHSMPLYTYIPLPPTEDNDADNSESSEAEEEMQPSNRIRRSSPSTTPGLFPELNTPTRRFVQLH